MVGKIKEFCIIAESNVLTYNIFWSARGFESACATLSKACIISIGEQVDDVADLSQLFELDASFSTKLSVTMLMKVLRICLETIDLCCNSLIILISLSGHYCAIWGTCGAQ